METVKKEVIKEIYTLLKYNGHNVTEDFTPYLTDIIYTDYEKDESDELNVILKDNDGKFLNSWSPRKGDKLYCEIGFIGYKYKLVCGNFTIDEVESSGDSSGDICTIRALAASINKPVRTLLTKGYDGKTLIQIANEIGTRQGFTVAGQEGNVQVGRQNQCKETDLGFLKRLANMFGYIFKITDEILTFIPLEVLENSDSLLIFDKSMINRYSFKNTSTKKYGACTVSYYDPKSKKNKTYTAKSTAKDAAVDTLKLSTRCSSREAAIKMANEGLKTGSSDITGSATVKTPSTKFITGVNITFGSDFGIYRGKYHLTQTTHHITAGVWEQSGEFKKC